MCVVLTGHRYNVPKGAPVDAKKTQLRVTVIVKYWVENQFFDFDEVLIARLNDWINNTLPKVFYFQNPRMVPFFLFVLSFWQDGFADVSRILRTLLDRQVSFSLSLCVYVLRCDYIICNITKVHET